MQGDRTAVSIDADTEQLDVPEHLLLLSAGIGITPNMALVRGLGAFVLQDKTNITMIHVERHEENLLFQKEIVRRAETYPSFTYTNIISSKEGRLSKDRLTTLVSDAALQQVYLCGPTEFMKDMRSHLVAMGVQPKNIMTESFDF